MPKRLKYKSINGHEPLSQKLLEELLSSGGEKRILDFKTEFDPAKAGAWQELFKDIVAIANAGGGFLIIGATNTGKPSGADLSAMQALDQAKYVDQLQRYVTTEFGDIDVAFYKLKSNNYGLIKIGPAAIPLIFNKDGNYMASDCRQKSAFIKGSIYTRHGSKSEPANQADLIRWFHKYHKKERAELLKGIRKATTLPEGYKLEQVPQGFRIVNDPSAPAFRPTSDPSAPELPFRFPLQNGKYENINDEFIGSIRAWKTDPTAYVPESQLWKFYIHREHIKTNEENLHCLLVSSMYRHCPVYYWALQMKRETLVKLLKEQINFDKYPAVNVVAQISFAIGGSLGSQFLKEIEKNSHYGSAKNSAIKFRRALENGRTLWQEYHGISTINIILRGIKSYNDEIAIKKDKDVLINKITELASSKNLKGQAKQMDVLIYGIELRSKTGTKRI